MREVMRTLFKSDFFKRARFAKVKSPTELVMGVLKLVGTYRTLDPDLMKYADVTALMGQELLNPPTVEGWHTGREWIDGGTMNERVNFAVNEVSDASQAGHQRDGGPDRGRLARLPGGPGGPLPGACGAAGGRR